MTKLLRSTQAEIVFIIKTKSSAAKSTRYLPTLPLPNSIYVLARGWFGGLWLLWGPLANLQIIQQNRHYIHAKVNVPAQQRWDLICVYGDPAHALNKQIWRYIQQVTNQGEAVCLIGDFNAVANEEEKYGGSQVLNTNNRDFRNFVFETGLVDLGFKGSAFTWNNQQDTSAAIHERLDRVLCTMPWCQIFPMAYVNHLPRIHSDHAPILLRTQNRPPIPHNFRVSWWFNHQGFKRACEDGWRGSKGLQWHERMANMKTEIKEWEATNPTPQNRMHQIQQLLLAHQTQHPSLQNLRIET